MHYKKGQVTLFIIIAVLIVAAALFSYFLIFRPKAVIPSEIQPVEAYFIECVDEQVKDASRIAGLQAGYLEIPEFEPGSEYMPFSSQLNFLGLEVPYWFYVSGNNLAREQKPSLSLIEKQFSDYLEESVKECSFESFTEQGYEISFEDSPKVQVDITADSIDTTIAWPFTINFGDVSSRIPEHKINTKSNFGSLYFTAEKIYDAEQKKLFLENYALDVLRLYAPMTDIELSCAPKTWLVSSVRDEIDNALEGNIGAIKVSGTYYSLGSSKNSYFKVDIGENVDEQVYFLYSKDMSHVFEVWPSENNLMKAEPIGTQPELNFLGSIGFCYVPYHFVYDLKFPVLIQVIKEDELFQFPVLVIIDKNSARNITAGESKELVFDLCQYKNQEITIFTYNNNIVPLEADLGYKCFNQVCDIGKTKLEGGKAVLNTKVPQCYNGFVIANAPGYATAKLQSPGIESFIANIFLKPEHVLNLEVQGLGNGEYAIVTFTSENYGTSVYYPEEKQINLAEGIYNVSVYLFKESSITLDAQRVEKCIDILASGVAGVFGATQEQCFEIDVPQETFTTVVFGGGKTEYSVTESELSTASKLTIVAPTYNVPKDILELGDIYGLIDISELQINLR